MKNLSILIPMRENGNIDIAERLRWRETLIKDNPEVEFLAVDDGSPNPAQLREICEGFGLEYVRLETQDAPFSLARARNAGIRAASGKYIYFEDLDFLHRSDFYRSMMKLIEDDIFSKIPFNFLSIPTLFLTEGASRELMQAENFDDKFNEYVSRLPFLNPDLPNDLCDSYAPVGSNILLPRDTCFHVGLFDEYFNSWGGEDREFVFRLLFHNTKLLHPMHMHVTKAWKLHRTSAFEGWRALYRLHGEAMAAMGHYAMHIHHPENPWKESFSREQNYRYCNDKIAAIGSAKRVHVLPKPKPEEPVNIFIGRNILFNNDDVMRTLGNVEIVEMDNQMPPEEFGAAIAEKSPTSVFFQNPYGRPWLKQVWDFLKAAGVRCVCAERGSFPGSIYFDEDFCAESSSYRPEKWQDSPPIDARKFVAHLQKTNSVLEPQGKGDISRIRELCKPQTKRNVLVLLQSLTDATTLHFTGELPDYDAFLNAIRELDALEDVNLLIKNHPLNKVNPLPGVGTDVSACNIYDLLSLADSCVTLNSGGGLLALGTGVPTITMGKCFYAQEGLAIDCPDVEKLKTLVQCNLFTDIRKVGQFYGYLLREFYSFADWTYGSRDNGPNAKMSIMSTLEYKSVYVPGFEKRPARPNMNWNSLIMVPYQLHVFQNKKEFQGGTKTASVNEVLAGVVDLDDSPADEILENRTTYPEQLEAASIMFYLGLPRESGELFMSLAEQWPKPNTLRAAAEAFFCAGDTGKAVDLYRRALEMTPGHRRMIMRLAELENETEDRFFSPNSYRVARPRKLLA